ncbi:MAG: threonine--tRNA ligase [Candidatus Wildermuthbacteria bacterium]|nr:threonine--tRNA ligase [Candidatus Wildermuthbacteria bacterium]
MKKTSFIEAERHSFAHVLASAVIKLYPKARLGIGPVIENGFYYDFENVALKEEDLPRLEEMMREIIGQNLVFKKELWPAAKARAHFKKLAQPYKVELVDDLQKGAEGLAGVKTVGMVFMGDAFLDLCRGGHVRRTLELPSDAFKLTKIAGAYWRGSEANPMLTRVYGVAFENAQELAEYLGRLEEAERRDHKKLGKELELFVFSDLVGPGLPLYTPYGAVLLQRIKEYSARLRREIGFQEVHTPQINKAELFRVSGHYDKYKHDMFRAVSNYTQEEYFLKPMNCPQHTQIYASQTRSYKNLPFRVSDFANLYRDEKPGELSGLTRLRAFSQDDGHCFCREDQIQEEFGRILGAIEKAMKTYGMKYWIRLSLRDEKNKEKYIGNDSTWRKAQKLLREILQEKQIAFKPAPGEAAFYGPKMDLIVQDSLGREWQLSTIQIDMSMPARFGLEYIGADGKKHTPVMIHSAIAGSPERFLGILIEHYAGAFPLWLAPRQIWILPVADAFAPYAREVQERLEQSIGRGIRIEVRDDNETLGKKIREGERMKVPYLLIVGAKEKEAGTVSVRVRGKGDKGALSLEEFSRDIARVIDERTGELV